MTTLAIVTLTAVRNGDKITLIDRRGEKVATISTAALSGVHQPEAEYEKYAEANILIEDSGWGRFARRVVLKDWTVKRDAWAMAASAMASSFINRHKPASTEIKTLKEITWTQSITNMHTNHRKKICMKENPECKWTRWADNVRVNCRKRFATRLEQG